MKILNRFFIPVLALLLLTSCDTLFSSKGKVIDKDTHEPLSGVTVNFKNIDSVYTDTAGYYTFHKVLFGYTGSLEMLLSKEGYKSRHISFRSGKADPQNMLIEMERRETTQSDRVFEPRWVSMMYYINMYVISLLNVLTLLFVIFKKGIKRKALWICAIVLLNPTFFLSVTNGNISQFLPLNGPVFLAHFATYPFSLKIVLPLGTLLFWVLYVWLRNKLIREKS
ncbi:carboxypeptidase-like regulatory domain-containing protein [Maribellus sp. YY47]|uniref:carboxypeptidase-like regulatory domain-containing protein n=1 Tax=Maribellus sp. YY47 TaxID=2929486 RepID=UPI0020006A2D|nr:carboxypeptidase-like regulatory domain-containing protein [Maribellus sp. YY47]MCK3685931.1 carboxypeptidase-like regulatory domain-containing protein [Maribellus sp. YY47]